MNLNKQILEDNVENIEKNSELNKVITSKIRAYALAALAVLSPLKSEKAEA
jgi:ABC-type polysaccharide/polyol phosphate transport system ATPase subunit